jgi:hypothetical protein
MPAFELSTFSSNKPTEASKRKICEAAMEITGSVTASSVQTNVN